MKQIKLVGRELSVVRAIEQNGSTGRQLHERTNIEPADLFDILNGLCGTGYVEAYAEGCELPMMDSVPRAQLHSTRFEINPSYYQEIKRIMQQR